MRILALSLKNARHRVVTETEQDRLLLVQIAQSSLDAIVDLLEHASQEQ